jgi:hypothetical protein
MKRFPASLSGASLSPRPTRKSFTAKTGKDAKEQKSLTAKAAKDAEENNSLTAKAAKEK